MEKVVSVQDTSCAARHRTAVCFSGQLTDYLCSGSRRARRRQGIENGDGDEVRLTAGRREKAEVGQEHDEDDPEFEEDDEDEARPAARNRRAANGTRKPKTNGTIAKGGKKAPVNVNAAQADGAEEGLKTDCPLFSAPLNHDSLSSD